jgi:hypothetical protein
MNGTRAWQLAPWVIRALIPPAVLGVYLLGEPSSAGRFVFQYVGRSDTDLRRRLLQHCSAASALFFRHVLCIDRLTAFRMECYFWHAAEGEHTVANLIHPAAPRGTDVSCPYCFLGDVR